LKLERLTNSGVDTGNQSEVEDQKTMCNQRFGHYHILLVGRPKGDAIHQNIVSNVLDSASRIPFEQEKPVH
jgi:long-chain acyl-CoA synthetase